MTRLAEVDVQVATASADIPDESFMLEWIERTLSRVAGAAPVSVSLRIVDREESRTLNRDYRERDKPTNVLSFPAGDIEGLPGDEAKPLGDLVLCAPVIANEADAQGKTTHDHWAHLLVHGTLHLLGYDHVAEQDADDMERLEVEILSLGGVGDPYNADG